MATQTKKINGASPYTSSQDCVFVESKSAYDVYQDNTTSQYFARFQNGVSYPLFDDTDKDSEPITIKVVPD